MEQSYGFLCDMKNERMLKKSKKCIYLLSPDPEWIMLCIIVCLRDVCVGDGNGFL